ncbi:vomeronasal 1 receptor monDomV1R1218 [Monodelphis domestica]|uniref:vomeronasal 1 receptor monDomV1R1218 n=1 Tax=Monodelphis domestica TaxID=13616 RepID=UPI0001C47935|nr:vomeronasal 1 receptor monDomV1R1218 [Monodelphis domestica]
MFPSNICLGIIFLSETGIGILANIFLLSLHILKVLANHKMRPINLIFTQLILANVTMLASKGIPQTLLVWGWNNFLDEVGCKIMFSLCKISQGLSISFTCLLCTFQAITISPNDCRWAEYKARASEYIAPTCLLFWSLNLLIEIPVPVTVRSQRISTNITHRMNIMSCSFGRFLKIYLIMTTLRNVLFVGLMVWTSGYMVLLLYRHHQLVQNMRSTSLSPRASPEVRATKNILVLVIFFVCCYLFNSMFVLCFHYGGQRGVWLLPTSAFMSLSFPMLSPFVLIPQDHHPCCVFWTRKQHNPPY